MVEIRDEINIDEAEIDIDARAKKPLVRTEPQTQGQLIHLLAEELKAMLKGILFPHADGTAREMKVYEQFEPYYDDDETDEAFPYCLVKFYESESKDVSVREEAQITIVFGMMYDDKDRQYAPYYFHLFNMIKRRFIANPFINNFRCLPEMGFALNPEDHIMWPYVFAAVYMKWLIPGIDSEVDFWNGGQNGK